MTFLAAVEPRGRTRAGVRAALALDAAAAFALFALALTFGLGDIAQTSPITTLLLTSVHALLPVCIALTMLSVLAQRRWPAVSATVGAGAAVWLAVLLVSALSATSHPADAIATLARPLGGVLLAWSVLALCGSRERWLSLGRALALGGLAITLTALAQASGAPLVNSWLAALQDGDVPIGDVPRVAATLSHPNETSMLLELTLPLLVAWTCSAAPRWRAPLALGAFATLLAIVLTFSRAGIVAALVSLAILAIVSLGRRAHFNVALIGLVALIVPLALGWAALMDPGLDRRLLAGFDESSTLQPARTQFWSVAVAMASDHPWLGVGPDNFRWLFAAYSGVAADNLGIHAHNQYLEALADTGLAGLLALLALFATLLAAMQRGLRADVTNWVWRAALLASLCAWLSHAVLDDFERFWPTSVVFWLIVGLAIEQPVHAADDRNDHQQYEDPGWAG